MAFEFIENYIIKYQEIEEPDIKRIGRLKHCFYAVPELYIRKAITAFEPFPAELYEFYETVGFGFMNRQKDIGNCILDPMSLVYINKQEGYLATEKVKEFANYYDVNQFLLFFHSFDEHYFAIRRETINGKNEIWYKDKRIANSLRDFIYCCYIDSDYILLHIARDEVKMKREKALQEKQERKRIEEECGKIRYLGGHILIDSCP